MRAFHFKAEYNQLLTPEVVAYLTQIHEYKGQQTMFPCLTGSPYRSAAMRGVTAAFTVSNRFIGSFSLQNFCDNFSLSPEYTEKAA